MLKRAGLSLVSALVAGAWGFSGNFHVTGPFARMLCAILVGFAVVSLLFSLFEEPRRPAPRVKRVRLSDNPIPSTATKVPCCAPGVSIGRLRHWRYARTHAAPAR